MIILDKSLYIKENELIERVDTLKNAQDKFLIMATYYGFKTVKAEDIYNIKVSDVDFEKNIIYYAGYTMKMNDYFKKITKEAIEQTEYERLVLAGNLQDTYKLNMESEYVIKPKPFSFNNYGIDPLKTSGGKTRFSILKSILGLEELTFNSLGSSKLLEEMFAEKSFWKSLEIKDYFEKNNIKKSYYRFYKLINNNKIKHCLM